MKAAGRFAAILGVVLLAGIGAARPATAQAAPADPVAMEQDFVNRINAARARNGVAPLSVRADLTDIARRWSARMAADGQLSHNPNLRDEAPANWRKLGENVGQGYSVDGLQRAFENSPAHHRNMVDPAFNTIGVGVVVVDGTIWVTEDFAAYTAAPAAAPAPAPAPPPPPPPAPAPKPAPAPAAAPAPAPAPAPVVKPVTATPAAPTAPPAPAPAPAAVATTAPSVPTTAPAPAPFVPTEEASAAIPVPPVPDEASDTGIPPALILIAVLVLVLATELSVHAVSRLHRQPVASS
jgi:hypothetical protein